MLARLVSLLTVVALLSGCFGPDGPADHEDPSHPDEGSDPVPPSSYRLSRCDEQWVLLKTPASEAKAYVPAGFDLVGVDGAPSPADAAALFVLALDCEDPEADEAVAQVWVHLVVDPPEEERNPDAVLHYVPVTWPVTEGPYLDALRAWDIVQAKPGNITVGAGFKGPGAASWETRFGDGNGSATLKTDTVGNQPPTSGGVVRMFGVADGRVTGVVDFTGTESESARGAGTFEDDGVVPLATNGSGVAGLALDYDYEIRPVGVDDP